MRLAVRRKLNGSRWLATMAKVHRHSNLRRTLSTDPARTRTRYSNQVRVDQILNRTNPFATVIMLVLRFSHGLPLEGCTSMIVSIQPVILLSRTSRKPILTPGNSILLIWRRRSTAYWKYRIPKKYAVIIWTATIWITSVVVMVMWSILTWLTCT